MKTSNKSTNLSKLGVFLFGISLFFLSCEKQEPIEKQEISSLNKFEKLFNKEDLKKVIPFSYDVDWLSSAKKYSKELEINFYEFDLIYNTPFNPTTINKSKKEGYNISYKLIVTESKENKLTFFAGKFFQKKDGATNIEDLDISLNKNSGYEGLTHLYDTNNELYFAKKISKKEIKEPNLYFKDKVKKDNLGTYAKDVTTCTTVTLYHYIDWYRYTYDAYGNLISVVYLYTEYVGSSSTTSCTTEFQPDEPIRTPRDPNLFYCNDGSGERNCVKAIEPQIMCEVGFEPDEDGNCVEVTKLDEDDLGLDEFAFSDTLGLTDEQRNWINDERNKAAKDAITDYLNSFAFTPEFENAKLFAYQGIVALMNLTNYINTFEEFVTSNQLNITNYINSLENPLTSDPIEFYLIAKYNFSDILALSIFEQAGNSLTIGEYTLTPHYDSNNTLLFYAAVRQNGKNLGIEYIIKTSALQSFTDKIELYTYAANLFYLGGIPSQSQIAIAAGDYFNGLTGMWGDALKDPNYYVYLAHVFVGTATNLNAVNSTSRTYTNNKISFSNITKPNSRPNYVINNRSFNQYKDLIQQKYNVPWQSTSSPNVEILTKGNIKYSARTFASDWQHGYTIEYYRNGVLIGKLRFYN